MESFYRCWAEIDLDQMERNYRALRAKTAPDAKMLGVVKADAYGHGALRCAAFLAELGMDWFAVSNLAEALQLRRGGIEQPILILGYTPAGAAAVLAKNHITQTVYDSDSARRLAEEAARVGVRTEVHIKVDTGMGRLGFRPGEKDDREEICRLAQEPHLRITGIFTHFASADENDGGTEYTQRQFEAFSDLCGWLAAAGVETGLRHCCNSAGILRFPEMHLDMVRAGISLYGLLPSADCREDILPHPVMSWRSVVSMVKELVPGQTVSYGRTFTAQRPMRVATVAVGYADGYHRAYSNRGQVLIRGKKAPILGRVCMDQCVVDVTAIPNVSMGDVVTLVGRDGEEEITFDHLAGLSGTINYELACLVNKRVDRHYFRNGKEAAVDGLL